MISGQYFKVLRGLPAVLEAQALQYLDLESWKGAYKKTQAIHQLSKT